MTHIVHIIVGIGVGGAEMMLRRLVEAHLERGSEYRHSVISLTSLGAHGAALKAAGIEVHALGTRSPLGALHLLWALNRTLRMLKPDIVQTWMYHADLLGGWVAHCAGLPVIWGIHSLDLRSGSSRMTRLIQKLCAWSSSRVPARIMCVAEASRQVHVACGYDARRIVVIPNGFDVHGAPVSADAVRVMRMRLGLMNDDVLIGCVGRFNPAKDHRNFVDAAALVAIRWPKARFVMVGTGLNAANAELHDWIKATGCPLDRFILLGERKDVPLLLASMDVFCSSSRTEAFPLVVGEAMLMARAAVVTDVGDTALLVGSTAAVVPPRNSQALADGISSLLQAGAESRAEIGRLARERVVAEFSMDRLVERTEGVYAEVLKKP